MKTTTNLTGAAVDFSGRIKRSARAVRPIGGAARREP